jgi:hypothetical protein
VEVESPAVGVAGKLDEQFLLATDVEAQSHVSDPDCGLPRLRIADCGLEEEAEDDMAALSSSFNPQSAIRNPQLS